ncbi:cache domain-containing protein, partial [Mangrovibrevibacter kandeliae]|uniref:cache domain-containing protein n=1 Tax=Mangrovibrevibacter kandeliae TaxID=2968473 RepID=UPI002119AEA6
MLGRLTISGKLGLLVALAIAVCMTVSAVQLLAERSLVREQREALLKAQVDAAVSIVDGFVDLARSGEVTEAEAKKRAGDALRSIRYGNKDYFFVTDFTGTMVVHPTAALVGQNLWNKADPNGFMLFQALIARAKEGGGFTSYLWPRNANETPVPKLSYSAAVPDWGWSIGTGVYIDDLDAIFWAQVWRSLLWSVPLLVLLCVCAWPLTRSITTPLRRLADSMRRLAEGDRGIDVPYLGKNGVTGEMAGAVESFKQAAIRQDRLEAEAKAAREAQVAERERQMAAEQAKAEELKGFVHDIEAGFERLAEGDLTVRMERPVAEE